MIVLDNSTTGPAWIRCDCSPNFICTIHQIHVHDCDCPPVEEWTVDPYSARVKDGET